jgi:reversibly glycosylated polypeptide/UDP-arabinopyranose mutase
MNCALVIPTIRETSIQSFLKAWSNQLNFFGHIIVVEDNPECSFELHRDEYSLVMNDIGHYSWKEISADLGDDAWIFSRRDSAIRSYGFLKAYEVGSDYIYTLDDDCLPLNKTFFEEHIYNLERTPRWIPSVPGHRTRGMPYYNLGVADDVVMSVGLWENVSDYDAIQTLSGTPYIKDFPETRVMPTGQYFPICGMNLCFRRAILPLLYFPLMGEGYPYRRFDDIWMGVICKKICDHLGLMITCGRPNVYHSKASDTFVNLVKEAPGIAFNEKFWEIVERVTLHGHDPLSCMEEVGFAFNHHQDAYINKLGIGIRTWCRRIHKINEGYTTSASQCPQP